MCRRTATACVWAADVTIRRETELISSGVFTPPHDTGRHITTAKHPNKKSIKKPTHISRDEARDATKLSHFLSLARASKQARMMNTFAM
ncbi:hypothetical protein quinque_005594 [Culex quinquefasciatus]